MSIFITQEAHLERLLFLGGGAGAGSQYASCVETNAIVRFGIYTIGQNVIGQSITLPGITASNGFSMAANGALDTIQHMVANVSQPILGSGIPPSLLLNYTSVVPDATSRSWSVIAASLDAIGVTQVCAIAWTGINPPPPGPGFTKYYGNVNIATDYGSPGNYSKAPINNNGIPGAYAVTTPRVVFRDRTLYVGFLDTNAAFNLWSTSEGSEYQIFRSYITPISGQVASLGVQDSKLVLAWVDGNNAVQMGYWNGEPTDVGFDWQGALMRHVPGGPDQAVTGSPPDMSQCGSALLLSWQDAQFGPSTALVTLP